MAESPPTIDIARVPEGGERISDEELTNLISSFGNHEAKAITLLLMRPGVVYPKSGLHRLVLDSQDVDKGWRIDRAYAYGYCRNSLEPIGLVAKELADVYGNTYGYVKTQYGEEKGEVLSALLLDFSNRHPDLSLIDLFGKTASGFKDKSGETVRAPRLRIRLLKALADKTPPSSIVSAARQLEIVDSIAGSHLKILSDAGLLDLQSAGRSKPYSYYSLTSKISSQNEEIEATSKRKTLASQIYEIVRKDPSKKWTIAEIMEQVRRTRDLTAKDVGKMIPDTSGVLMDLVRGGYLEVGKFHRYSLSTISMNDEQKKVIGEIADILTRFQDQDPNLLNYGRGLVEKFRNDANLISGLMKKAKIHSPDANRSDPDYVRGAILAIVTRNTEIDTRSIQEALGKDYGIRKTIARVNYLVNQLISNGDLTVQYKKGIRGLRLSNESAA